MDSNDHKDIFGKDQNLIEEISFKKSSSLFKNEFNLENCREVQSGEEISNDGNNDQDFHFPLDFDLNINDPNLQDDIIF